MANLGCPKLVIIAGHNIQARAKIFRPGLKYLGPGKNIEARAKIFRPGLKYLGTSVKIKSEVKIILPTCGALSKENLTIWGSLLGSYNELGVLHQETVTNLGCPTKK